jgi:hypothetical protein
MDFTPLRSRRLRPTPQPLPPGRFRPWARGRCWLPMGLATVLSLGALDAIALQNTPPVWAAQPSTVRPALSTQTTPLQIASARPVLNQSAATLQTYFGAPIETRTIENEAGETLEVRTYDPTGLRQAVPGLGDLATLHVVYQGDRVQSILVSPLGAPSPQYTPEMGQQLFRYIFGYGSPVWFELPRPAMGIGGYYEGRACLGDGVRTDWEQAAALISVRLFYDTACEPPYGTFPDIRDHWSQDYVEALVARNILNGYPDGSFRPDGWVTRAEFAAIIAAALDPQPRQTARTFQDVGDRFWASAAITQASAGGYLNGCPNGTFGPQDPVLRQDVYVALANGLQIAPGDGDRLNQFGGGTSVPDYARAPLAGAIACELSPGADLRCGASSYAGRCGCGHLPQPRLPGPSGTVVPLSVFY